MTDEDTVLQKAKIRCAVKFNVETDFLAPADFWEWSPEEQHGYVKKASKTGGKAFVEVGPYRVTGQHGSDPGWALEIESWKKA